MAQIKVHYFFALIFFSLNVSCSEAQSIVTVPVANCNGTGTLLGVRVSNCTSVPCLLKRGTKTTVEFDFIPNFPTITVTTGASAKIGPIRLPFVGVNGGAACSKIVSKASRESVGCILNANQVYTYSNTFDIQSYYPPTSVLVQWELNDNSVKMLQQRIVCFQVPAKIV